ncbi:uncharacterized protein LOC116122435 [Pistacia vera]|uniref:uncharacterized protein LOC116122435 n=1 Tax=Pistacia vera TaxID=55513 RepID=UPI0012637780|nr:uncharacterized protein LOC116122435 [Pistacia vera]
MACDTPKEAWDKLKEKFGGSSQTKNMQALNLRREFEMLKIQETKNVKEYVDRLINVVNKIKLPSEELTDHRIVERVCKNKGNQQDQQAQAVESSQQTQESTEQLFVVSECMVASSPYEWLIDSGYTNHMTPNASNFVNLDEGYQSKVKVGNGELLEVKGKDFSRMTWVHFLNQKSEVVAIFKRFKLLVENQTSLTLKTLRSDNGGEYTSNEFEGACKGAGIWHQFSSPYTLQQNGVSERKNRTVMEMARCMMIEKNLPKIF